MAEYDVGLLLEGDCFRKNSTTLHDLVQAYDAFEGIIDCTYSKIVGISRFSEDTRDAYKIVIKKTVDNSWDSFFDIVVAVSPVLFGNVLSPTDLLATAKTTYDFLKCVFGLRQANETYSIQNGGDGNVTVNAGNGNQYVFNAPVNINLVRNAEDMIPELEKVIDLVNRGALDSAKICGSDNQEIARIGKDEARLFELTERPSDDRYEFEGEIYRYNKRSRTGRLQVKELQGLPFGNYTFRVFDPKIQDEVIMSMVRKTANIIARPIVVDDPISLEEQIIYLEIVDV